MFKQLFQTKRLALIGFLASSATVGASYYFEYVVHLNPCPLCLIQRYLLILLAVFFLGQHFLSNRMIKLNLALNTIQVLLGIMGIIVAGWQSYLERFATSHISCGPSLEYMLEQFSYLEILRHLFSGDTSCNVVQWSFLGLSMAEYGVLIFIGLTTIAYLKWAKSND